MPSHAGGVPPERYRLPAAMLLKQMLRDYPRTRAVPPVTFLQGDDIGVDFGQHIQDATRVALPVETDALMHVVAGDLYHNLVGQRATIGVGAVSATITRNGAKGIDWGGADAHGRAKMTFRGADVVSTSFR